MDPLDSMAGGQIPKNFDAENAANNEDIEKQFAVKAVQHMQTYWSILERVRGSSLRLTKIDDEIMEHLKEDFPEFDPAATVDEDEMKSKSGKERWRKFMMNFYALEIARNRAGLNDWIYEQAQAEKAKSK
ncbi:hypothetical protein CEP52_002694 [Fusarium oligoseptatum]|uniref:Polysaccharide biosynthesis domain-containing protein n=1 Tax=Fusarium oligoseptatum TaxID=2604345 RepID=A0A428UCY0_9HYPO|nr:hypothetical protein CEP52_002694 [Fusarium oligoseptatum]